MPHPNAHSDPTEPLSARDASAIAEGMKAFGTPSRVRLLFAIYEDPMTVDELAAAVEMEPSAVSQQLRILRQLKLVIADREGRHIRYRLHDHHVGDLLASIRHHHEHASSGWPDAETSDGALSEAR